MIARPDFRLKERKKKPENELKTHVLRVNFEHEMQTAHPMLLLHYGFLFAS